MSPQLIKEKYNLKKNRYILYLGRFVPEKRIEWLIETSNFINIPIVIAGGSSHSEKYVKYLHKKAKQKNIIFTGYVFGREKEELLSNCSLFVLPSSLEGYPIVIEEVLKYGKKCLIGDFIQKEYSLKDKKLFFFSSDNNKDFNKKLLRMLK